MPFILGLIFTALLVFVDQFTKWLAITRLAPIGSYPFIPGFMQFRYHINTGAAFGILEGGRWFFVIFTAVVFCVVVYFYIKLPRDRVSAFARAGLILLISGALGNGIDRFIKGYVVDFLEFQFIDFPIFNGADVFIVSGTILLTILIIFFYKDPAKSSKKEN